MLDVVVGNVVDVVVIGGTVDVVVGGSVVVVVVVDVVVVLGGTVVVVVAGRVVVVVGFEVVVVVGFLASAAGMPTGEAPTITTATRIKRTRVLNAPLLRSMETPLSPMSALSAMRGDP